jgi:hypothetical protein
MSQQINLLDAIGAKRGFSLTSAAAMACGVLAAAALTLGLGAYEHARLAGLQTEALAVDRALKDAQLGQAKATGEIKARSPDPADDARLSQLEAQLRSRNEVAEALNGGVAGTAAGFSRYMMALSRQSLPGVWLTGFDLAAGGSELTLSGRALNPELLPAYLQRLTQEAPLQGRRFASMVISQPAAVTPAKSDQDDSASARKPPPYIEFVISSAKADEGPAKVAAQPEATR